jgi:hypothetical protein
MDLIQIIAGILFVIVLITLIWRIRSRRSKS